MQDKWQRVLTPLSVCETDVRALKLDHRYYSSVTDISMNS
jgi:hypothetical protein